MLSVGIYHMSPMFWQSLDAATIQEKKRRRMQVCPLHDNARPHVASATRQQLEELGWTAIPHPPYSPDLAPSDLHLFRFLKNYLRN
jgi:hypothetical protein